MEYLGIAEDHASAHGRRRSSESGEILDVHELECEKTRGEAQSLTDKGASHELHAQILPIKEATGGCSL